MKTLNDFLTYNYISLEGIDEELVKSINNLDGQKIFVPKDPALRPNKEYFEWHNDICFENWLKYGEFSLIDKIPHD